MHGINTLSMIDYPFQVIVQFPKENYLSSDTFPNPIELFVTERFRSTIFDLDFSYPEGHAQTISCSYSNPTNETYRQFLTFISGTLLTLGITLCLESYREKRIEMEKKTNQEEKPKNQEGKESEESYNETIIRLIRLVDNNFKFNWFDVFFSGDMALPFSAFIMLFALIEIYLFSAPTHERIVVALSLFAVTMAFFSLMLHSVIENIVKVNFKRFGMRVEKNQKPLLKALIKMKVQNREIELEQIYNLDKSVFDKEQLLERLYE